MGIRIDKQAARRQLAAAVEWARSDQPVPDKWVKLTEAMDRAPSKTYTPALGTALLARATDERVDALSIKESYAENTYSQRTLCHTVLVPAAVEYGFSLRNTGREPLNNQPFFRYDHMTLIDRVSGRALEFLNLLRESLEELNKKGREEALAGLAAFLRVRFAAAERLLHPAFPEVEVPLDKLIDIVDEYLGEDFDRPRRTQALAAAAFDLIYNKIGTRKLNDPSRDFPGDIQAFEESSVIMSAEIRAKPVPHTEVQSFVQALRNAGVSRGFVVVIHPSHERLDRESLLKWAWSSQHVVLTIIESAAELIRATAAWSTMPVEKLLAKFPARAAARLKEIEVPVASHERWVELVGVSTEAEKYDKLRRLEMK